MFQSDENMKTTLHLAPVDRGPLNYIPARTVELEDEEILCNDVTLPGDFNPHNTRLFVIGHEFGAICALWAQHEQDAFDELVDSGNGDSFLVSEEDQKGAHEATREEWAHLGYAGEPCDLSTAWIQVVQFDPARDWHLLCKFAEARGNGARSLYF